MSNRPMQARPLYPPSFDAETIPKTSESVPTDCQPYTLNSNPAASSPRQYWIDGELPSRKQTYIEEMEPARPRIDSPSSPYSTGGILQGIWFSRLCVPYSCIQVTITFRRYYSELCVNKGGCRISQIKESHSIVSIHIKKWEYVCSQTCLSHTHSTWIFLKFLVLIEVIQHTSNLLRSDIYTSRIYHYSIMVTETHHWFW